MSTVITGLAGSRGTTTGTQPLRYQSQCEPSGEKGEPEVHLGRLGGELMTRDGDEKLVGDEEEEEAAAGLLGSGASRSS